MSLILSIETGTDIWSVGLVKDGRLVSLRESGEGRDHARRAALFVDEILSEHGVKAPELSAVAVGKGPGSYTGLRIGVSLAKGICYGAGVPLIGIGSLEALAEVAAEDYRAGIVEVEAWDRALLCPMVDARRMEVYAQVFDTRGNAMSEVGAHVVDGDSFAQFISPQGEFVIFGNGAPKCAEVLPARGVKLVQVAPSARGFARLAQRALEERRFEDTAYFEPFYLKDFMVIPSRKKIF